MAWAGHFFLKILVRDWNIGPSCITACSDRSGVVASFKCSNFYRYYGISSAELARSAVVMSACLVDAVARSDRDYCARGTNKKNLQNSVQCVEGDTEGVICELWMARRRSTAWTVERNTMWMKRSTVQDLEKSRTITTI